MAMHWKDVMQRFNLKSATEVWGTQDEIAFIVGLGMDTDTLPVRPWLDRRVVLDRKTLLKNYLKAAERRVRWDGINKQTCLLVAALLLDGHD
jgi:hypothetical protein